MSITSQQNMFGLLSIRHLSSAELITCRVLPLVIYLLIMKDWLREEREMILTSLIALKYIYLFK